MCTVRVLSSTNSRVYRELSSSDDWGFMLDVDVPHFKWFKLVGLLPNVLKEVDSLIMMEAGKDCCGCNFVQYPESFPMVGILTFSKWHNLLRPSMGTNIQGCYRVLREQTYSTL
jgi:hypothetical protein